MRILQVIANLQMGGAEKLLSELVPRLQELGHEVDVAVFDGRETPFMRKLRESGVRIISLNNTSGNPYSIKNLFKLIPVIQNYEIVHSHTTSAQLYCSLVRILFPSVIFVTTEHSTSNHRRGKWFFKILDRCIYKSYIKIICIGQMSKENLEKQIGKQKEKILVIENGIDVELYRKADPVRRSAINCQDEDYILTMVGRFTDAKDQKTIIKSLSLLPDNVKLVLVGDGPLKEIMCQYAHEIGVGDRVIFLGLRNDVPSILKASDVVVMSSHWEGFGLAAVEGMACSKPVIASNVPGLREVVENTGLLFDKGDAETLSQLVLSLKNDADFCDKIASRCFERAQQYDIDIVAKRYGQFYKQITAK